MSPSLPNPSPTILNPTAVPNSDSSDTDSGDEEWFSTLWSTAYVAISFESAHLEITSGDQCRHVYGEINVAYGRLGRAYSIYRRPSHQPETVSVSKDLTLCGPNCYLPKDDFQVIYVNLYEKKMGSEEDEVLLRERVVVGGIEYGNVSTSRQSKGDKGTLTISFTTVSPSVLANLRLTLLNAPEGTEWLVHGTAKVIQTLPFGGKKRELSVFKSAPELPVKVLAGKWIPLDRKCFLAPVLLEEDLVQEMNDMVMEQHDGSASPPMLRDASRYLGTSVSVDVNLRLTHGEESISFVECPEFVAKGKDALGEPYISMIKGNNVKSLKRKHSSTLASSSLDVEQSSSADVSATCIADTLDDDAQPKLEVMVWSVCDLTCKMDGEPFEKDLPLYQPRYPQPSSPHVDQD